MERLGVVDVGGGSTELAAGTGTRARRAGRRRCRSAPAPSAPSHLATDPPVAADHVAAWHSAAAAALDAGAPAARGPGPGRGRDGDLAAPADRAAAERGRRCVARSSGCARTPPRRPPGGWSWTPSAWRCCRRASRCCARSRSGWAASCCPPAAGCARAPCWSWPRSDGEGEADPRARARHALPRRRRGRGVGPGRARCSRSPTPRWTYPTSRACTTCAWPPAACAPRWRCSPRASRASDHAACWARSRTWPTGSASGATRTWRSRSWRRWPRG